MIQGTQVSLCVSFYYNLGQIFNEIVDSLMAKLIFVYQHVVVD